MNIFTEYRDNYSNKASKHKLYNFQYMEDSVKQYKTKHITRDMIAGMPFGIFVWSIPMQDVYGEDIDDFDDWHQQRETYIDYLYKKYKR